MPSKFLEKDDFKPTIPSPDKFLTKHEGRYAGIFRHENYVMFTPSGTFLRQLPPVRRLGTQDTERPRVCITREQHGGLHDHEASPRVTALPLAYTTL